MIGRTDLGLRNFNSDDRIQTPLGEVEQQSQKNISGGEV